MGGEALADRHLDWAGCCNIRDLGGLPTTAGRLTRRGALVRADSLDRLTAAGWAALWAYGIRTVVDLRHADERAAGAARPPGLTTVPVPLEDPDDRAFGQAFGHLGGTPLYFQPFLTRQPGRVAAALTAVARAAPGGVLIHCGAGRDRTGLVTLVLLALAGVAPEAIAADYALSAARLRPLLARLDRLGDEARIREQLAEAGTTAEAAILATLAALDSAAYLRGAGVSDADLAALRARLLAPA
jgi:protein-tyrosine phosphatase